MWKRAPLQRLGGRIVSSAGKWALPLLLSACSGMHLHSETREQQGKDLSAAWEKVNLQPYFSERGARRKALVEAELDAASRARAAAVSAEQQDLVASCVGAGPGSLRERVRTAIAALTGEQVCSGASCPTGPLSEQIDKWRSTARNAAANERQQAPLRLTLAAAGVDRVSCGAVMAAPPDAPVPEQARDSYAALKGLCVRSVALSEDYATAGAKIARLAPARPGLSWAALEANRKEIAKREADAKDQAEQYGKALDQVAQAAQAAAQSEAPSAQMADAVEKLHGLLDKIAKNVEARHAAAAIRIRKLDAVLAQLGRTGEPPSDASRGQVAAVLLTRTADAVHAWRNARKPPPAASLLLRRDLEAHKLEAARRELALLRQKSLLLEARFAADIEELRPLLAAQGSLERHSGHDNVYFYDAVASTSAAAPREAALGGDECGAPPPRPLSQAERTALIDAAGSYFMSVGPKRIHSRHVAIRLDEVDDELAQEGDAAALAQRAELVEASARQAAAFAASGQKPANWLAPVQVLLLAWIGQGVHR